MENHSTAGGGVDNLFGFRRL